jgi:hypothetical protein
MKTKHFDTVPRSDLRSRNSRRVAGQGMRFSTAALGLACVAGVFGLLALLYHLG